jgi:predicted transposase YbfD/YdcC
MKDTTLSASLHLPNEALLFDLDELYACLQTIPDHRHRRGVRYPLASLLMIGVLAKLAGQDASRAMAHWAKLRTQELSQLLHLKRECMPHYSTWSRILGQGVEPSEVEQIVGRFFAQASQTVERKRGSIQLAIDGKTLRGTIPLGKTEGVHLLAVYLPQQGVVLAQMNVEHKGREISFAPTLLNQIDLRGVVVSGDAMFDRRSLSLKIVQAHADYLWIVKENEKGFYQEIELLFQPQRKRAATSAPPMDFRRCSTIEREGSWTPGQTIHHRQ